MRIDFNKILGFLNLFKAEYRGFIPDKYFLPQDSIIDQTGIGN